MQLLAQYYDSGSGDVGVVILLIVLLGLGFIPATIANSKGYSAVGFYFFGLFFFLPALIVVLVLPNKKVAVAASPLPRGPDPIRPTPTLPSSPSRPSPSPLAWPPSRAAPARSTASTTSRSRNWSPRPTRPGRRSRRRSWTS